MRPSPAQLKIASRRQYGDLGSAVRQPYEIEWADESKYDD